MNAKVYALESIRRMRGGSQPQLMRCSDGEYYVVKFQNNPQGLRVLANELLGGLLAKLLGLPVPEVRIIEVDEYLIKYTDQMVIQLERSRVPLKSGLCVGSRYPQNLDLRGHLVPARVCDFLPQGMFGTVDNIADFLGMLVFDSWVGNMDQRQVVFVQNERKNLSSPYYSHHALMIDEGFCFNGCKWNFPISSKHGLFATANVYAEVSGLDVFEVWLNRLESVIDRSVLELAAFEIPLEWNDGSLQSLDRLVTKLDERRHQVRDLLCATRKAVPRFFPMWQEQIVPPRKAHAKNRIARRRVLHEKLAISLMSRYVRRLMKRS
jgi:hypothetical protein